MARTRTAAFVALARALRGASRPGAAGLGESLRAVPRWVTATLTGRYHGTTRGQLGLLALAALYVVSPVDLLPEMIPLIGLADDAVVVTWLAGRLVVEAGSFLEWERTSRAERQPDERRATRSSAETVPGHVVR
jgi:uncharacterized membrane protein YkvA (DUF1232 family)